MYAGGIAWSMVDDTLYAHQDKKDDIKLRLRSTALLFSDKTQPVLNAFSAAVIASLGSAGYLFFLGLTEAAAHLVWQVNTVKIDD